MIDRSLISENVSKTFFGINIMFNIRLVGDQFSALRYCYFSNGSEGNVFNLYKVMFGIIEMKGIGCD